MKSILIIGLTLLPLSSFSASGCFGGIKNEIEMLELTYMTEKELIDEYCYASNSMKRFIGGGSYFSENINACSDYSERIFRILRKDHGIKSMKHIECPEWKKEIEKENKADKEKAKEDFLFMLDLFNKSYNSGKMDKDTFNDRLYKMLDSLGQKGVYTRKELIEIEAANKKTDEPPSETMPPECVMTPPTELDSSVARENLGFKGKAAGVLANGSYVPIFPVPPVYPRRALERDIEGCVMLKFTVTKTGSTRDPSVEWAVPPGIFDRAAMTSALKYKYKPQIRDGEAIEVPNFRTIVIFKIEDANKPVD